MGTRHIDRPFCASSARSRLRPTPPSTMSMKNLLKTRTYRERAQPAARQHLGLLEKHKDYVQRARDFHKKEDAIKKLKEKASFRNPDEYYFKMAHTSTEDGVHKKAAAEQPTNDEMRKFKKEDASYLMVKQTAEAKKIERLRASLHMLDAPLQNKHTIFVSDEEKGRAFEVKGHGRTPAEAASAPPVQQPNKKTGKKRMREAEERAAAEAAAAAALDDDDDDEEDSRRGGGAGGGWCIVVFCCCGFAEEGAREAREGARQEVFGAGAARGAAQEDGAGAPADWDTEGAAGQGAGDEDEGKG